MSESSHLFSPLTIRRVTIPNRVFLSPMCQYSAREGYPGDWHRIHYGTRAVGGAGLVMLEATAVVPEGRISGFDLGIWDDEHAEALAPIARFISEFGAVPGIQLAHAGRKGSSPRPWDSLNEPSAENGGWTVYSADSAPFAPSDPVPLPLTVDGIQDVVGAFADAARRAVASGFRVVEVHAAHGYLLHQFLSPLCNRRIDGYGGDVHGRMRIVRETVSAVRDAVDDGVPVMVRISATDWHSEGWTEGDTVLLARELRSVGADFIDCSSGGIVPDIRIPAAPGYQVPFAEKVRSEADIRTGAVGLITDPRQADGIIREGRADAVLLGRELLRNPYWPRSAANTLDCRIPVPPPYLRAW